MNLISVQQLDPYRYQKVLEGYEVGSLDRSSKDIYAIKTEPTLINQHTGLVKYPAPTGAAISSVSEHMQKISRSPPRGQKYQYFPLSNKLLQYHIKTLLEKKSAFYVEIDT